MDKWEQKVTAIRKASQVLEELQDDYRKEKRKLEEESDRLTDFRRGLSDRFEAKYDAVLADLRNRITDGVNYSAQVGHLFESYFEANHVIYGQQMQELEEKADTLEADYRKQYAQQEEKIEKLYAELRVIDLEEDKKG